jgi:hypothetical protein
MLLVGVTSSGGCESRSVSSQGSERCLSASAQSRARLQIWAGAGAGLFVALCIGAAFVAIVSTSPSRGREGGLRGGSACAMLRSTASKVL